MDERAGTRIRIRDAAASDVEALALLAGQLGYAADAGSIARRLASIQAAGLGAVLVAVDGEDVVVGFVQLLAQQFLVQAPFVELIALVVAAAVRGRRVGARLLDAVEAWARARAYGGVYVRSNVVRTRAHHFYLREGYTLEKRQAIFFKPLAGGAQT